MSDTMILLVGMFCTGLTVLGMGMTAHEFSKTAKVRHK